MWGIEAAVLFQPGSGQALLAFVLERKRAVGIVKNARHKEFVKRNLAQAVKTLGLAPDRRPPKPAELVAWESSRTIGGAPPAARAKAAQPSHGSRLYIATIPTLGAQATAPAFTVPTSPQPAAQAAQPSQGSPPAPGAAPPSLASVGSSALR